MLTLLLSGKYPKIELSVNYRLNYSAIYTQPSLQSLIQLPAFNWALSFTNQLLHFTSLHSTELHSVRESENQSQSYFMTGGLPPISCSWCQAPWDPWPALFLQLNTCSYNPYITSSLTRGWVLSFTIAAGPRQCVQSRVQVPRDSWLYFTVSHSRLPQPGGPGPRIYIPKEQGGPVIPPGTGFAFHHLLRLTGLWWRCLNPPPHGVVFSRPGVLAI
jgi:hypothetical protein